MEREGGNKGVWAGLVIVLLAALAFLALWHLRGEEIHRLTDEARSSQTAASQARSRLEDDVRNARRDLENARRQAEEAETRFRNDQNRADENTRQMENRFRIELERTNDQLTSLNQELADARKRSEEETAKLQQKLQEAESGLAASEKDRERLEAVLRDKEQTGDELRSELEQARAKADKALAASAGSSVEDALKKEISRLETGLRETREANAALEDLRNRLSQTMEQERKKAKQREDELLKSVHLYQEETRLSKEALVAAQKNAAATASATGSTDAGKALREKMDGLEKEIARLRKSHSILLAQRDSWQRQLDAAAEKNREELQRITDANDRRLQEMRQRLRERETELQNQLEVERTEWRKRLTESEKPKDAPQTDSAPQRNEAGQLDDPGHFVGKVVEVMPDGTTYLISDGARQGVRPGMKFDVHRREGNKFRFVGMLKVTRAMDNYSMAVTENEPDVLICPITGRAVLDPKARFSPFALDAEGKPAPLVSAKSQGVIPTAPAVDDLLDNPFFNPERGKIFALNPDVAADTAVLLVKAMGGTPCLNTGDPGNADFIIEKDTVTDFEASRAVPRPTTLRHMFNYWGSK